MGEPSRDQAWDVLKQRSQGLLKGRHAFVEGLADGSLIQEPALQGYGLNSILRTHLKVADVVVCTYKTIPREVETGNSGGFLANQPKLICGL